MKPLVDKLNKLYKDGKLYSWIIYLYYSGFATQFINFFNSGVEVNTPTGKIQVHCMILMCSADLPAKAKLVTVCSTMDTMAVILVIFTALLLVALCTGLMIPRLHCASIMKFFNMLRKQL